MGKRGFHPAPVELQQLRGAQPCRIPSETKPRDMPAQRPDWLSPEACEVWDDTLPELEHMGLAYAADTEALAAYCVLTIAKREALLTLQNEGASYTNSHGNKASNPVASQAVALARLALVYAQHFGLTPSGRRDLGTKKADQPEADRLLEAG